MIQNVLRAIGGIGVFDSISICLFIAIFSGSLLWAARAKQTYLKNMSSLPLEPEDTDRPSSPGEPRHE